MEQESTKVSYLSNALHVGELATLASNAPTQNAQIVMMIVTTRTTKITKIIRKETMESFPIRKSSIQKGTSTHLMMIPIVTMTWKRYPSWK